MPKAPERAQHPSEAEYEAALASWWEKFKHHSFLVIANRHSHQCQGSCLHGKRGKTGCR